MPEDKKSALTWSGRFSKPLEQLVKEFNASISFDRQLFEEDVLGSAAHARMLCKINILSKEELDSILGGLKQLLRRYREEQAPTDVDYEDIHFAVEKELKELIGPVAGKLHTARSRNDQVSLDLHLFVRKQLYRSSKLILNLASRIAEQAEQNSDVILPGYTHLQRAQPITLGFHLGAYLNMLLRDLDRMIGQLERLKLSPLGAGALAGTTFAIDREFVADLLGFEGVSNNALDTVSNRDFVVEYLFAISLAMTHLSRLCEELVVWSSREFSFIELDDGYCTGSSMMPQKKNPDIPELIRGKTGRTLGALISILTVIKGLPLAYNKDLQEDKEGLFDANRTLQNSLTLLANLVETITWKKDRMLRAVEDDFSNATDLADYLVGLNIPFREAHEITGQIVRKCVEQNVWLKDLSLNEFQHFAPQIKEDIFSVLRPENVVKRRQSVGGTAPKQVKAQLSQLRQQFAEREEKLERWKSLVTLSEEKLLG